MHFALIRAKALFDLRAFCVYNKEENHSYERRRNS